MKHYYVTERIEPEIKVVEVREESRNTVWPIGGPQIHKGTSKKRNVHKSWDEAHEYLMTVVSEEVEELREQMCSKQALLDQILCMSKPEGDQGGRKMKLYPVFFTLTRETEFETENLTVFELFTSLEGQRKRRVAVTRAMKNAVDFDYGGKEWKVADCVGTGHFDLPSTMRGMVGLTEIINEINSTGLDRIHDYLADGVG